MGPRLNWAALSIGCHVQQSEQWDYGTKIIFGRLFHLLLCNKNRAMGPWDQDYIGMVCPFSVRTTDRTMGPWDQDYIREARPFAAMNYKLSNGTKSPRLYLEGLSICCYIPQNKHWDHGTKNIFWRMFACTVLHTAFLRCWDGWNILATHARLRCCDVYNLS
jgi:hypothetical protein